MRITRKAEVDLSRMYKRLEPFILTADTILTAETIMADYKKVNNMSTFPRRMTISRKQTGLIKASLRDYVNVVSGRRPSTVDPIQTLVDEYKAYAATLTGYEVIDEIDLYDSYEKLVSDGIINEDGTVIKAQSYATHKGAIKKTGGNILQGVLSLVKIGGNFIEMVGSSEKVEWSLTDGFNFSVLGGSDLRLPMYVTGQNSFFIEFYGKIAYLSALSYNAQVSDGVEWPLRNGVNTSNRQLSIAYNSGGGSTTTRNSADDYYIQNEKHIYRMEVIRTGNDVTRNLYRDGVLFGSLFNVSWDFPFAGTEILVCATGNSTAIQFEVETISTGII